MKREPSRSRFQRVIRICGSRPAVKFNKIVDEQAKKIDHLVRWLNVLEDISRGPVNER